MSPSWLIQHKRRPSCQNNSSCRCSHLLLSWLGSALQRPRTRGTALCARSFEAQTPTRRWDGTATYLTLISMLLNGGNTCQWAETGKICLCAIAQAWRARSIAVQPRCTFQAYSLAQRLEVACCHSLTWDKISIQLFLDWQTTLDLARRHQAVLGNPSRSLLAGATPPALPLSVRTKITWEMTL